MSTPKRINEARERHAKATAALAAHEAEVAREAAEVAAAKARRERFAKRLPTLVVETADTLRLTSVANLSAYGAGPDAKKNAAALAKAGNDAMKLTVGAGYGGVSYSARGLAGRSRVPTPADLRTITLAARKRDRAKAELAGAEAVLSGAMRGAFERGTKVPFEAFIADAAKALALGHVKRGEGNVYYTGDNLRHKVEQADKHLAAAKAGTECQCQACIGERAAVARAEAEAARIAALPTILDLCPNGHKKRLPFERTRAYDDKRGGWVPVFRVRCPADPGQSWDTPADADNAIAAACRVVEKRAARLAAQQSAAQPQEGVSA